MKAAVIPKTDDADLNKGSDRGKKWRKNRKVVFEVGPKLTN